MEVTAFYIASQILAFAAIIFEMLAYQQKKKHRILGFTIVGSVLYGLHYLLLEAWSGVATKLIAILRDAYVRHKSEEKQKSIWPLVGLVIIYVVMAIITFQSIWSFLPLMAALVYTIGIYNGDEQRIRIVTIVTCLMWLVYNFSVRSYVGMASDLILITSSAIAYFRYKKKSRN